MAKKLSEMTLEELWKLFPIFLTAHKAYWEDWYSEEKEALLIFIPYSVAVHHIGSTAINGIWAKPIIDILIESENTEQLNAITLVLQESGYLLMGKTATQSSLNKGYTENGFAERVFHIHIRLKGGCEELYFRDYLNTHAVVPFWFFPLKDLI